MFKLKQRQQRRETFGRKEIFSKKAKKSDALMKSETSLKIGHILVTFFDVYDVDKRRPKMK